jgi:multidrug efflux pump subunit AcrA (membrane-fusion protein)
MATKQKRLVEVDHFFCNHRGCGGRLLVFQRGNNDAPQYQTTPVARGELTQVVTATGTLNPVVNVTVGSQVSGIISKLNVDFNSPVKKGGHRGN